MMHAMVCVLSSFLLWLVQAKPHMEKSSVVDSATGKSVPSEVRTSSGTFLGKGQDDIISRIEKRVAQVTMIPVGKWGRMGYAGGTEGGIGGELTSRLLP